MPEKLFESEEDKEIQLKEATSGRNENKDSSTQVWIDLKSASSGAGATAEEIESTILSAQTDEVIDGMVIDNAGIKKIIDEDVVAVTVDKINEYTKEYKEKCLTASTKINDTKENIGKINVNDYWDKDSADEKINTVTSTVGALSNKVNTHVSAQREYVSKADEISNENVSNLITAVDDANEKTTQNVENTVNGLKTSRENSNNENKSILGDFSTMLPNTRIGSVENTQAYDFMASPVNMNQTQEEATAKKYEKKDYSFMVVMTAIVAFIIGSLLSGFVVLKVYGNRIFGDNCPKMGDLFIRVFRKEDEE